MRTTSKEQIWEYYTVRADSTEKVWYTRNCKSPKRVIEWVNIRRIHEQNPDNITGYGCRIKQ